MPFEGHTPQIVGEPEKFPEPTFDVLVDSATTLFKSCGAPVLEQGKDSDEVFAGKLVQALQALSLPAKDNLVASLNKHAAQVNLIKKLNEFRDKARLAADIAARPKES